MKRAFFKLGRSIKVKSSTTKEEFLVEIDVEKWEKKKEWDLEFTYARPITKASAKGKTSIEVKKIYPAVGKLFELASFQRELIRKLGITYSLFLKAGLKLSVNKVPIKPELPEIADSAELRPVRRLFKADGVDVLVLAGITPREDRQPRGWFVFCNGRMVVEADKTTVTGWGEGTPQFHNKYNHFLGLAYFRSNDLLRLPWTTTKDGVETESPVYQVALGQMRVLAKPVLDFLGTMYEKDIAIEGQEQLELLEKAGRVSVETLARRKNRVFEARLKDVREDDRISISYKRSRKDVIKAKAATGNRDMSNRELGEYTFDYFLKKEA